MYTRKTVTAAAVGLLLLVVMALGAVSGALGGPSEQVDPTAQQQTVEALVNDRFTQTAVVQQALALTQTAEAATLAGPAQTAAFEATVEAAFEHALAATAQAVMAESVAARGLALLTPDSAARLDRIAELGAGDTTVSYAVFGPQGLLTAGDDFAVQLWDVATGAPTRRFEALPGSTTALAASPDGRWVAAAAGARAVHWDAATGEPLGGIELGADIQALAFSADGRWLAAGLVDGGVHVWDLDANLAPLVEVREHTAAVRALAFAPDGATLASGADDGIRLMDVATGAVRPFGDDAAGITDLAFSPDGAHLAAVHADGSLRLWDILRGTEFWGAEVPGAAETPLRLAFGPTGLLAVGGSEGAAVTVFDAVSGDLLAAVGEAASAPQVAFSSDGALIASVGDTVSLWGVPLADVDAVAAAAPTAVVVATPSPRPEGFPTSTAAQVQIAEQLFEHGRMFWIRHNRQIWVMVDDPDPAFPGGDWFCYNDTFVEGEPETDPSLEPPDGASQPRRGFGKLWRNIPELREALGWAITPEFELESSYTYIPGGYLDNGNYVPGPGEHRLTTLGAESLSFFEQDIRGDCLGGTWRQTR